MALGNVLLELLSSLILCHGEKFLSKLFDPVVGQVLGTTKSQLVVVRIQIQKTCVKLLGILQVLLPHRYSPDRVFE